MSTTILMPKASGSAHPQLLIQAWSTCGPPLMLCLLPSWSGPVAPWCFSCSDTTRGCSTSTPPLDTTDAPQRPEPPAPSWCWWSPSSSSTCWILFSLCISGPMMIFTCGWCRSQMSWLHVFPLFPPSCCSLGILEPPGSAPESWQIVGETMETVTDFYFGGLQNHCRWWLQPWNYNTLAPWKKSYDQSRQHIKKQRHYLANKGPSSQSYGLSSSRIWMWELDHKESWMLKNWCFWTVVLKETLERPLDCKEIQPVHPKGNQAWIFIGKTDAEAETPILWPPDAKNWLIGKEPDAGKDWRREEKGMTEDEMVGWHHWFNGDEFVQTTGDSEGWGSKGTPGVLHSMGSQSRTRLNKNSNEWICRGQ